MSWKKIVQMRLLGIGILALFIAIGAGGYWWYLHDQQQQAAFAFVGAILDRSIKRAQARQSCVAKAPSISEGSDQRTENAVQ